MWQRSSNRWLAWCLALGGIVLWPGSGDRSQAAEPEAPTPVRVERNLVFREVAGTRIKADLYRPDDEKTYPLIVMIHGGAWSVGDKWDLKHHAQELARAGFVAVSVNYRLAPSARIQQQLGDCRFALQWAAGQADAWGADGRLLGLWGYSAGAQLAALLALQPAADDPPIAAIVAGGIPSDFSFVPEDNRLLSYVMGGTRKEKPEVYRQVAPLECAHAGAPPFFIFHGDRDQIVPQHVSQRFADKLEHLDVAVQYKVVSGKGHLLTFFDQATRQAAVTFLQSHLERDSQPRPSASLESQAK